MIKGFEEYTGELTEYERNEIFVTVYNILLRAEGAARAITNKEIIKELERQGKKIADSRIRAIIHVIRTSGMINCLISTSRGYYIAMTASDVDDYLESLEGRINSIRSILKVMRKQKNSKFEGRLF